MFTNLHVTLRHRTGREVDFEHAHSVTETDEGILEVAFVIPSYDPDDVVTEEYDPKDWRVVRVEPVEGVDFKVVESGDWVTYESTVERTEPDIELPALMTGQVTGVYEETDELVVSTLPEGWQVVIDVRAVRAHGKTREEV